MPYDIAIFRGDREDPTPIRGDEAVAVLRGVRATDGASTEWRVWADDEPWFVAHLGNDGVLTLSASYTHPGFLELLPRFGAEAARIGAALGAAVVEEVAGGVLTPANVDATFARTGTLFRHMCRTSDGVWAGINREGRAPLDFPVGPIDMVGEYFMFHIRGAPDASERAIRAVLAPALGAHRLQSEGGGALSVLAPHDAPGFWKRLFGGAPHVDPQVKVLARPDGVVQIWAWWEVGLSAFGPLALDLAKRLHAALGGQLTFDGMPFDAAIEAGLKERMGGTLTDLWIWTEAFRAVAAKPGSGSDEG